MHQSNSLTTALCLPNRDIHALAEGRTIAAIAGMFIRAGQQFALYPYETESIPLLARSQQLALIPPTQNGQLTVETIPLSMWARCELCQILDGSYPLEKLTDLTHWSKDELRTLLQQKQHLFLVYLRVFRFPRAVDVLANLSSESKVGKFIGLPNNQAIGEILPVLSDRTFAIRKRQLENLEPPEHPELEELHSAIAQLSDRTANRLQSDIAVFLGWQDSQMRKRSNSNSEWIQTITQLGNRSLEEQEGKKSNWRAGTDFEIVVRDSLKFLGFGLDATHQGGAGGIDLYCKTPYPLVGECKCGKSIPGNTVYELDNLGDDHLDDFASAVKLIIGPGQPTSQLKSRAQKRNISIMSPMALQKLVELENKYPGCIDLIELKKYLEPGQIDHKIDQYIDKVRKDIHTRAQVVQIVQQICQSEPEPPTADVVTVLYNVQAKAEEKLTESAIRDLLIELSSPLTGYLGRRKSKEGRNRYYFLRSLNPETEA